MTDGHRLLIISPVRNEAEHLEQLARGMERQIRPPDLWLVVDDGSTDDTHALAQRLATEIDFMRVLETPPGYTTDAGDRHAVAAAPRAFNWALRSVDAGTFTHLGKIDGDIELPPEYFSTVLAAFAHDPELGIAGGVVVEQVGVQWKTIHTAPGHVRGALKVYSRECFEAIGGLREHLGWDGVDQTYARMRGYRTVAFDALAAKHHRACGSADGLLRGRVRGGRTHYIVGFTLPWVLLKSAKWCLMRPRGISGAAFLYGYLQAAVRRTARIEDADYLRFVRGEQRQRLRRAPARLLPARRHSPV